MTAIDPVDGRFELAHPNHLRLAAFPAARRREPRPVDRVVVGLAAAAMLAVFALDAALATDRGRTLWHATLLKLPVVGSIARKQEIARLALVVSTMLASGVVLVRALEIAGRSSASVLALLLHLRETSPLSVHYFC